MASSSSHPAAAATRLVDQEFESISSAAPSTSSTLHSPAPRPVSPRPATRRRASQPVYPISRPLTPLSIASARLNPDSRLERYAAAAATATTGPALGYCESDGDGCTASGSTSHSGSEDEDDLNWSRRKGATDSFEYLDLSLSVPYTLVTMRASLLHQLSDVESRVRLLVSSWSPRAVDVSASAAAAKTLATFQAQAAAIRADAKRLTLMLPRVPAGLNTAPLPRLAAKGQDFLSEWDTPTLPKIALPSLPMALPAWPAVPHFTSVAAQLPANGASILAALQDRLEAMQSAYAALTLRDLFSSASESSQDASAASHAINKISPGSKDATDAASAAAHSQLDILLARLRATGEEVRARGHARASSVAKKAREMEDAVYHAALELAGQGQRLIRYENLPELWKNNEHILSGYRFIPSQNFGALLRSTFEIHNETGNIHSHLLGAVIIIPLFWPSKGLDADTTPMDRLVQTLYLAAALKCLVLSVSWHVMAGCANACWFERFACVDYTGIAWLVAASVWTLVYNGFYCQPNLAMFYSLTTLIVGAVGATVPWAAWFNERSNKGLRIAVFLTMCFTALAPFTHAAFEHGLIKTLRFFAPIAPSLLCYVGGLMFYAFQFPERYAPGRFDIWGHAHQIWHVAIVGAILLHYRAALIFHANRFDFSCTAHPSSELFSGKATLSLAGARLLQKAGGLQGIDGLNLADHRVHQWRRVLGALGGGMVGKVWDGFVDWTQTW
ncbi:HlyIII-domain-containing protein [Ceraceosorus guamensis]|uniref:HlyIII-domain-containing protein n=1 Tax=Ceraceosorus guamensis TaxID=1522189 RepID=A0A316VRB6_9BASI|nr:HlyIII-domain-containing protein [Ceraceosorus guamensis]PWN38721.1 HlyIII-domain-containing protein [Ceraceosorus guamensis]